MKKHLILGILFFASMVLFPGAAIADRSGPPTGLDVKIVNQVLVPVTDDFNANVSGDVNIINQPTIDGRRKGRVA